MKCLVTGGAGFIGSNLVSLLYSRQMEITVLDNFSTGYELNLHPFPGIKIVKGDICDRQLVDSLMPNQDVVFHLAASVGNKKSIESPYFDTENNAVGVLNILESMRKFKVETIVFSSSAGIFGEPQYQPVDENHPCAPDSPYGVSKLYGEKMCLAYMKLYSIRAVCFRYFNVYGVNQRFDAYGNVIPIFCHQVLTNQPITIFGDGEQTRDFICVEDIANANLAAALNSEVRGPINLGTGKEITINELANNIISIAEKDGEIKYGPVRPGDVRHCTCEVYRMEHDLGIKANVQLRQGLKNYLDWMRKDPIFLKN